MATVEEREWAVDAKYAADHEYTRVFAHKYPNMGAGFLIPRETYLAAVGLKPDVPAEEPESATIPVQAVGNDEPKPDDVRYMIYTCECGQKVKSKVAFGNHQKRCKVALNSRN